MTREEQINQVAHAKALVYAVMEVADEGFEDALDSLLEQFGITQSEMEEAGE